MCPPSGPFCLPFSLVFTYFTLPTQVITACGHKVGWLIAKKSWDRMVPGFFARAMSCIPVARPQVTTTTNAFGTPHIVYRASYARVYLQCADVI